MKAKKQSLELCAGMIEQKKGHIVQRVLFLLTIQQ